MAAGWAAFAITAPPTVEWETISSPPGAPLIAPATLECVTRRDVPGVTAIDPPTFVLFVNDPALVHFSYKRFLERSIRESADFEGTAIKVVLRGRVPENPPE